MSTRVLVSLVLIAQIALSSCGAPSVDLNTALGKRFTITQTNIDLSSFNCAAAYDQIYPLYNSRNTDNEVRMLMGSTYACFAGLNLYELVGDIVAGTAVLGAAGGMFALMTLEFPSTLTPGDKVVENASNGIMAAQSMIRSGVPVIAAHQINAGSFNVGSTLKEDRMDDGNSLIFFTSWAVVGGINGRYGVPNATGNPTVALNATYPWTLIDGNTVDATACEYASALVNFADTLTDVIGSVSGPAAANLALLTNYRDAIYSACDEGCQGTAAFGTPTTCALSACATCPQALRKKSGCATPAAVTDSASCAAAGIMNMVASHPIFGWQ